MTAPGGATRASYRIHFKDRTIIVSQRQDPARRAREAHVLAMLGKDCAAMPEFLGATGGLVFQSDAGARRLNYAIHACPAHERPRLAAKAVAGIFAIHRAARQHGMTGPLPSPQPSPIEHDDLVAGARRFAQNLGCTLAEFDPARLHPLFRAPPRQLIKWDCRAGNAALDEDGTLRWFDFEDARMGHGPEDFAWLIADETWPLDFDTMLGLVRDQLTDEDTTAPDAYLTYLEQVTVLHALRRIRLIMNEARARGWSARIQFLKYDKVGVDPHLGERLSEAALALALRHPATSPLAGLLKAAMGAFHSARMPTRS